jgi:hypothetical protein
LGKNSHLARSGESLGLSTYTIALKPFELGIRAGGDVGIYGSPKQSLTASRRFCFEPR